MKPEPDTWRHCRFCNAWIVLDSKKDVGKVISCDECGKTMKVVSTSCRLIQYTEVFE